MANKADKWANNAGGKFYVDQQCIDCDLCRETAPAFFTRNDEGGHSFVHKQPESEDDIALCMEALEALRYPIPDRVAEALEGLSCLKVQTFVVKGSLKVP